MLRDLVENWVVWRDAGDWERFRTVWHDDGVMNATWFQGLVWRQPIYEKDNMATVGPGPSLALDTDLLARFPVGYSYLAYLQSQAGFHVKPNMPGLVGTEVEVLYDQGRGWLAGSFSWS
jgi:hypothetical protein